MPSFDEFFFMLLHKLSYVLASIHPFQARDKREMLKNLAKDCL
jgi:hypothetical protein